MPLKRKKSVFVITGPSGVGKSAIIKGLFKNNVGISFSVSATTRKPRANEVDGVNYHFLSKEDFLTKVENNEFVEYTEVFGNYYGTLLNCIEDSKDDNDLILDLEIKGARALKQKYKDDITSIFILPPDANAQRTRLSSRNDNDKSLNQRLNQLAQDVANIKEYDYILVNDVLKESTKAVESIIKATRLAKKSYTNLDEVVKQFDS